MALPSSLLLGCWWADQRKLRQPEVGRSRSGALLFSLPLLGCCCCNRKYKLAGHQELRCSKLDRYSGEREKISFGCARLNRIGRGEEYKDGGWGWPVWLLEMALAATFELEWVSSNGERGFRVSIISFWETSWWVVGDRPDPQPVKELS